MRDIYPDVIAQDARLAALADLSARLEALPVDKALTHLVDAVDERLLPHLAYGWHVTDLEGWRLADTPDKRRALLRRAIALHSKKGTPWAVMEALRPLGVHVNIIEQADQRRAYAALDPVLINGTWQLDGSVRLRALDRLTYIPQVQHWAQFIARINLADVTEAGHLGLIKALVEEWKPASRHAIYQLWLALVARHSVTSLARLHVQLPSTRLHPWDNLSLSGYADVGWRLGASGVGVRLPAPFGFVLGRVYGAVRGARLSAGRVRHRIGVRLAAAGAVFRPEVLPKNPVVGHMPPARLFWRRRRLDGTWRLTSARLDGRGFGFYLRAARLYDCHRLDGRWPLGEVPLPITQARLRLSGLWRVGGPRVPVFSVSVRRMQ